MEAGKYMYNYTAWTRNFQTLTSFLSPILCRCLQFFRKCGQSDLIEFKDSAY